MKARLAKLLSPIFGRKTPEGRDLDGVIERAWNAPDYVEQLGKLKVPTMLTDEERRMLVYLAEHTVPEGTAICDLGPFLGGSTFCLGTGLKRAGRSNPIHSYDLFELSPNGADWFKETFIYPFGFERFEGMEFVHVFDAINAAHGDLVSRYTGDVQRHSWTHGDIGLLFVDLSKDWPINDHVVREFFPAVRPGAFVVQQDILYPQTPWLFSTMYLLREKMPIVSYCEYHSAVFQCVERIGPEDVERCLRANVSKELLLTAIDHFEGVFPYRLQKDYIRLMRTLVEGNPIDLPFWDYRIPPAYHVPLSL